MSNLKLVYLVFKQFVFDTVRFIFSKARNILWRCNGNFKYLEQFETSAQLDRIVWRSKKSIFEALHPRQFLGIHSRFDNPNIVSQDNVLLISVNEKNASFLELKRSIHHYAADKVAFCWISMFSDAVNIITMPLSSFHMVADSLGPIEKPCSIICHAGRTGSTLLVKLIQLSSKRILALSEPDTFGNLADLLPNKSKFGRDWNYVVKSTVRLIFKPISNVDAIVIKDRPRAIRLMKYVSAIYPEIKFLYLQRRNQVKTVQSWQVSFADVFKFKLMYFLAKYDILQFFMPSYLFNYSEESVHIFRQGFKNLNLKNKFEFYLCLWTDFFKAYVDLREIVHFNVLYYEDLLDNPNKEIRNIFKMLNIGPDSVEKALELGLKSDSQKHTPLSKHIVGCRKFNEYTDDIKYRVDQFMDNLRLPRI